MPGVILVVTAPSGTGKTTLLKKLLAADPRLKFSVSYTTRRPRPGETPGRDYFFVSPAEFHRLKDRGGLVEWVEQFGYWYGTSREWVEQTLAQDLDLVFDIETRGARSLKAAFPEAVLIFILPPSLAALESRLRGRGDLEPLELARRLEEGRAEFQEVPWYDFLVVNDDLEQALSGLQAIVSAVRCRTSHLWAQLAPQFEDF